MTDKPFIDAVGHPDPIGLALEVTGCEISCLASRIGFLESYLSYGIENPNEVDRIIRNALNWLMYGERCK